MSLSREVVRCWSGAVRQAPAGHVKDGKHYSVGSLGAPGASGWTGTRLGIGFKQVSLGVDVEHGLGVPWTPRE